MTFVIPLPDATEPDITQSVSLEGRNYVFTFDWNSRTNRWTLSLATDDGIEVLNGALLMLGVDILRTVPGTLDSVPPGQLVAGGVDDPDLESINGTALFYEPSQ